MLVKETTEQEKLKKVVEGLEVLEKSIKDIPTGYLRMELSTKGILGAPKVFHVRNFDTKEIVELSITATSELPLKLANILDRLILEDEVSINSFHENEVIELIVKLFAIFYDQTIELDFPWNEEDIEFLEKAGETAKADNLKSKTWVPKTMVNLATLDFFPVDEKTLRKHVELTSKKDGFKIKFSYPKFGDVIVVKKYLDSSFKESDKNLQGILKRLEVRKKIFGDAERNHREVDTDMLPFIAKEDIEKYTEHETNKALFAVDLIRALHLESFEGKDLSEEPISGKIEYISDPRVTHNITQIVEREFKKMKFGVNPEISIINPITNETTTRRFLFRIVDLLSAVKEFESDEYDIGYE